MEKSKPSNPSSISDTFSRESLLREWNILKFVWRMAERYRWLLFVAMLVEVIIGVFPALAIYFIQDAISGAGHDIISLVTKENFLWVILLLFIYLLLQKGVSVITAFAIIDVEYNIRMRYLAQIVAFPMETITNHLDNRAAFSMTRETSMTSALIPMIYRSFFRAPVTIISAFIVLMVISSKLVILILLMMALVLSISLLMRTRLKQLNREQNDATSSLLQYFNEWLVGHRIYHVYRAEKYYERKMVSMFDTISEVSKRHKLFGTAQSILVEILTYVAVILFVVFLSDGNGYIDIGIMLSFPAVIMLIRSEIIKLVAGYQQLATTESSVARLQWVLQKEAPQDSGSAWKEIIHHIELINVSYWYESPDLRSNDIKRTEILKKANLRLSEGSVNVLTGPNGTGKSTTVNLILGLLEPKQGLVCYNGKDIRDYSAASRLAQFAIVEQEPFVFQGSLWDNITLGRDISDTLVRRYLHDLALDYLLDEQGGMSLSLGPKGRVLSSGEKQRLALVRALVGEPSVIILDEPTSNIDQATSAFIRNLMCELAKKRLVICISHDRLMTNHDGLVYQIKNGTYVQHTDR